MATLTSYGTTATGASWTTPSNALYSPGTFATLTTTVVATYTLDITNLNISSLLPANAVIDRVVATIPHYISSPTNRWSAPTLAAIVSGAVISGTTSNLLQTATNTNVESFTYTTLTTSQLRDSTFGFRYSIPKSGTQTASAFVDFIKVDIDYRSESWQEIKL